MNLYQWSKKNDFAEELAQMYIQHQEIYNKFFTLFSYLPLAAKVGDYLCLHGGISPSLKTVEQI